MPRIIIYNNCEQINMLGDILNAGDNVEDQEGYWFTGSFFKISPTIIYDYTKKKGVNMQIENLRPQMNVQNIDEKPDEKIG